MKIDEQIIPYLAVNTREALSIDSFENAKITKLTGGDYNFNYHVNLGAKDLLVRLCIEPQSGLDTQIEYEYQTLEALIPSGVTPKPLYLDNSREHFPYGLLIEEFIPGGHLQFSVPAIRRVAEAMAALHSVPTEAATLRRSTNPLKEQLVSASGSLDKYKARQHPQPDVIRLGKLVVDRLEKDLPALESMYSSRSIIHTDPNPANIIDTGEKVYFIDWEQGRIDDPSYDVAAFFSDVLNLWASPRILSGEEKAAFIDTYTERTGDRTIEQRIPPRLQAYTLAAVTWAANRIADVEEGKIDPLLGAQNYDRYKKMANPVELEKVLAA